MSTIQILVVGMNYRTAPVEVRERFTFAEQDLARALKQLKETKSILECVIVSTCNRTEIYAVVDHLHMCGYFIRDFMERWFEIPRAEFTSYLSIYEEEAAIEHLLRVTAGLNSMVIGETQILGQIKTAFLTAQRNHATGTIFNNLFKQAITVAKRAHSETTISENPVSISYAAVELGKQIFGDFKQKRVMIMGAGKMSELTAKHLHSNGAEQIVVINRSVQKAIELAGQIGGEAVAIEKLDETLLDVDILISSTGAAEYVLTFERIQAVMKKRKARPLFMIDIAVPRDIDPMIAEIEDVMLYDIDDLENIVQSNLKHRETEAVIVESMIKQEMVAFNLWRQTLSVNPLIQALQHKATLMYEETMSNLMLKLPDLDEREKSVVRKLSKSMVNQMLRDPIMRIKDLAAAQQDVGALEMFTRIFALEDALQGRETSKADKQELLAGS